MSLPRMLSLNEEGTVRIEPIEELKELRMRGKKRENIRLVDGSPVTLDDVRGNCLELDMTIEPGDAESFGVKVACSPGGEEQTSIECDFSSKCLNIDVSKSGQDDIKHRTFLPFVIKSEENPEVKVQTAPFELKNGEKLRLRIFIDRSIIEVFANARQCVTQRIYPSREDSLGVVLFSKGGNAEVERLRVWQMAPSNTW